MKRHKFFLPKKYLKSACASLNKIAVNYVKSNTLINYKSRQN
jgi:hypothetical protein